MVPSLHSGHLNLVPDVPRRRIPHELHLYSTIVIPRGFMEREKFLIYLSYFLTEIFSLYNRYYYT